MKIITPANPAQLDTLTAADAAQLISERKVSSEALVRACLARIETQDHLNAFITVNAEQALAQAKAWDKHLRRRCPLAAGRCSRRGERQYSRRRFA